MAALLVTSFVTAARADDPTFTFAEKTAAEAEAQGLKAAVNAGLLVAGGNSNSITVTGGGTLAWRFGANKIAAEALGAYARSQILVADDENGDGALQASEIKSQAQTSVQSWSGKARYDRFFLESLSAYLSAAGGADKPSGKKLYFGGQIGVSYHVYTSELHDLVTEAGYDLTHETYFDDKVGALQIHSARLFISHTLSLADSASLTTSIEGLTNISPEDTPTGRASSIEDTRVNFKTAFTAKVWGDISARFSFTAKFDNVPAPRPPFSVPYAPGVVLSADKLDTQTELALIMNF